MTSGPDRILIVDLDPADDRVWRYGLADPSGQMVLSGRLHFDPDSGDLERLGPPDDLFGTAALLVRQKRYPSPITYDLTIRPLPAELRGPSGPSTRAPGHRKATEGKAKGGGRTLGERADLRRDQGGPERTAPS